MTETKRIESNSLKTTLPTQTATTADSVGGITSQPIANIDEFIKNTAKFFEGLSWNSVYRSFHFYNFMTTPALIELTNVRTFLEVRGKCGTDYCWDEDVYDYDVSYAAIEALSMRGEEGKRAIVDLIRNCKDSNVCDKLIDTLVMMRGNDIVRTLIDLARNCNEQVCNKLIDILADIPGDAVVDVLIELGQHHFVLDAIASHPGTKATSAMINKAKNEANDDGYFSSCEAVKVLGKRQGDDEMIINALIDIAKNGQNRNARKAAIMSLAYRDGPGALVALVDLGNNLKDELLRAQAIHILELKPEGCLFLLGIKDPALSRLPHREIIDLAMKRNETSYLRGQAIALMAKMPEEEATTALLSLVDTVDDNEDTVPYEVLIPALAERGERGIQALLDLSGNSQWPEIRNSAAVALIKLRVSQALRFFLPNE